MYSPVMSPPVSVSPRSVSPAKHVDPLADIAYEEYAHRKLDDAYASLDVRQRETISHAARRVDLLSQSTADAAYHDQLTASRLAAAKARADAVHNSMRTIEQEARVASTIADRMSRAASSASRAVNNALSTAEQQRTSAVRKEMELQRIEAARAREAARVARLSAEASLRSADLHHAHQGEKMVSGMVRESSQKVKAAKNNVKAVRRSLSATSATRDHIKMLHDRDQINAVRASSELRDRGEVLAVAATAERSLMMNHSLARGARDAAYVSYCASEPLAHVSPRHRYESELARHDLAATSASEEITRASAAYAMNDTDLASHKLREAENHFIDADLQQKQSKTYLTEVEFELLKNRHEYGTYQEYLERAKMEERERRMDLIRAREAVVLNATELAKKRVSLKRAKDRLNQMNRSASSRRQEVNRLSNSSIAAERALAAKLQEEAKVRADAVRSAATASAIEATLVGTRVGVAQAREEEAQLASIRAMAHAEALNTSGMLQNEVADLLHLEADNRLLQSRRMEHAVSSPLRYYQTLGHVA